MYLKICNFFYVLKKILIFIESCCIIFSMFKRTILSFFVLNLCVVSAVIAGNTDSDALVFTWANAVHQTKLNNLELQSSSASVAAADAEKFGTIGNFLPQIYATGTYTKSYNEKPTVDNPFASMDIKDNYNIGLQVSQSIFKGGSNLAKYDAADANADIAIWDAYLTKAKVSYDLKAAFESLVYAKEYLDLSRDILKRRRENMELVQLRFANGLENKGSVMMSEAYYSEAKFDEFKALNDIEVAKKQLAQVLGIDDYQNVDVVGDVPVSVLKDDIEASLKSLALQTPTYKKALATEELAKANRNDAFSNFLPSVDLSAKIANQDEEFYPAKDAWSVAVNVRMPLFSGGSNYMNYKAKKETLKAKSLDRINSARSVLADISDKLSSYKQSVEQLKVKEIYRDAAQVRAEIARQKYNNGLMTFDEWDRIENDLISQQKAYILSKQNRVVSEAAFEQALGIAAAFE